MTARRYGATAAALVLAGGGLAHVLDEEGLLPGVREVAAVREYGEHGVAQWALPLFGLAVAALVGVLVARSRRARRALPLFGLVVAGQAAFFASYEVVARLHAGLDVAEVFAEPAFAAGLLVQCLIGAAFVALLLLASRVVARLRPVPRPVVGFHQRPLVSHPSPRAGRRRAEAPPPGRAPPFSVAPVPYA